MPKGRLGLKAVISHLVVKEFQIPCAPAPALLPLPLTKSLNPKSAAEEGLPGTVPRLNVPQRIVSLIRFRAKRKELNFDKTIRYSVRKEVALRMKRNKGQFTSSKANEDSALAISSWDSSNQGWTSDANGSQNQKTLCVHCGISEKSTPMMRRGPDGPRTLYNACGLMWANKTLDNVVGGTIAWPTNCMSIICRLWMLCFVSLLNVYS